MKFSKYAALSALIMTLSSCGSGSCFTPNNQPTPTPSLTLKLTAPNQYPAGVEVTAYLTITNNSNVDANDLVYTVPSANNYTGVDITIDPFGAGNNCTSIKSGASCVFTANIPAGSHPGNFTVIATPQTTTVQKALNKFKSDKELETEALELTASIGLSDTPNYPGMFYIMPETKRVATDASSNTVVQIVVLAKPNQPFDTINFLDKNGTVLQAAPLGQNPLSESVITYNLTIPAGHVIQDVMLKASYQGTPICQTATDKLSGGLSLCSNTAYVYRQGSDTGFLSIEPRYSVESPTYSKQVITVTNQGNAPITNFKMPDNFGMPLRLDTDYPNTCANTQTLAANASCSFRVKYSVNSNQSGSRDFSFSYYDGKQQQTAINTISYIGTKNESYALINVSPDISLLGVSGESSPVTFTNIGTATAEYFYLYWNESNYPVYIASKGSCLSDNPDYGKALHSGDSCTIWVNFWSPTTTAGSSSVMFYYYDAKYREFNGQFVVNYPVSSFISPTKLSYVTPESGSSGTEYYTTVSLVFTGPAVDQNTVNANNIQLLSIANDTSIGLTAPIFESGINENGEIYTSVNFASLNQLNAEDYKVVVPNLNNIRNLAGTSVVLDSKFTTSNPLSIFTAQGITSGNYCGGSESCFIPLNANNTMGACWLLGNGGIVNCGGPSPIAGLNGSNITVASTVGFDQASQYPYDNSTFFIGTNTGLFANLNPMITPYTAGSPLTTGQTFTNATGMSTVRTNDAYSASTFIINSGLVYQCSNVTGFPASFNNCAPLNMTGVSNNAYGIFVDNSTLLANPVMIITNKNSNSVTTCVANNGSFANVACQTNATDSNGDLAVFNKPMGVAATDGHPAAGDGGKHFVFIANSGFVGRGYDGAITRCEVSSSGSLINCEYFSYELYANPISISISTADADHYINVGNQNGSMTACSVGYDGIYCNRYGYTGMFESSLQIMQWQPYS